MDSVKSEPDSQIIIEMEMGSQTVKTDRDKWDHKRKQSFKRMDDLELYLRSKVYPPNCDRKSRSSIRRTSRNFVLRGDVLWYKYRGRLRRVLRKEEEVREVLMQYHDNNDHAGQSKMHHAIISLYYWGSIEPSIKKWVSECETCRCRPVVNTATARGYFQRCIAYGCGSNSNRNQEGISFYRFPRDDPARLDLWVALAQRDRWSIQSNVYLCSKHFTDDCFENSAEGRVLRADAVPTLVASLDTEGTKDLLPEFENEDDILELETQDTLIVACSNTRDIFEDTEHQYALPPPETNSKTFRKGRSDVPQTFVKEPCFVRYDALERYMVTGTYSNFSKAAKSNLRRLAKNFAIHDGVLMNIQRSVPRRVLRNRKEVNAVLKMFHEDQGHRGLTYLYRTISTQYVWSTMSRDLADWIANCDHCSVERESRKHQCSVYNCINYSGPVERGLGLTFHKFPIHKPQLLSRWVAAMGRRHWYPRPRSVVCSGHFTEDCFDRSGGSTVLKDDAVPSLSLATQLQQNRRSSQTDPTAALQLSQTATGDETFFTKYDAVDRYLRNQIYPPGLTFVEKNTIRRFCKKFTIKDDLLHIVLKNRVRKVLRSREEVNEVLVEFHDELNHLDAKKCMRLLTERVFWGTMVADVAHWIQNCDVCSHAKKKARMESVDAELDRKPAGTRVPGLVKPPTSESSGEDDDGPGGDGDEGGAMQQQQTMVLRQCLYSQEHNKVVLVRAVEPGILKAPAAAQASVPVVAYHDVVTMDEILQPQTRTPTRSLTRAKTSTPTRRKGSRPVASSSKTLPFSASGNQKTRSSENDVPPPPSPALPVSAAAAHTSSKAGCKRAGGMMARTVIQQCTQALLKVKPPMDGVDAEWVEIQQGMVVYVCFLEGATEKIISKMVETLVGAKLFRTAAGQMVSVRDLPGSILLIPQDTLAGNSVVRKRVLYHSTAERWWGAQLYSQLVEGCERAMENCNKLNSDSASVGVKHGIYGNKQEILINSKEPFTLLLEF